MTKKIIIGILIALAIIALFAFLYKQSNKPGKYDAFAQCITDSGTKFYGAWWCPHCQNQKTMFGNSAKNLPYIECQTSDRKMLQICTDEGIQSYPTWKFPDGSVETGELSIEELAAKTQCSPDASAATTQ